MRRAVLVAASRFEDPAFPPLQFAVRDAERLQEILEDPALGGFDQVIMLANPPGNVARIGLERTARACDPGDVLLFYFSGHGKLDRDGSLALAMSDSDTTVLGATSLVSDELKRILNLSKASQKIMILDCCYSGAVGALGFKGALGDSIESLAQNFRGSFLLAASQRFERAWENEEKGAGALTSALVEGVKTGAASKSGRDEITLSDIASYVKRTVPRDSPQLPEYWDSGGIGDVVFSRKPLVFDAEWTRKVKAMVTRFVSTQVFDEDFADSIRAAVRLRDDPRQADRMKLLDRLLKRELQISTFVTTWPTLGDSAASTAPDRIVGESTGGGDAVAFGKAELSGNSETSAVDPKKTSDPSRTEAALASIQPDAATGQVRTADIGPPVKPREEASDRPLKPASGPADQNAPRAPYWMKLASLGAVLALVLALVVPLLVDAMRTGATGSNSTDGNAVAATAASEDTVTITATEDVWLRIYENGGSDLYQGTLPRGRSFQLPASAVSPLISTGRPEAIQVKVGTTIMPPLGAPQSSIRGASLKPADLLARAAPDETRPAEDPTSNAAGANPAQNQNSAPPGQAKAPDPRSMRVRPAPIGPFMVYFDFESATLSPQTVSILDNAIASILPLQRGSNRVLVRLDGYINRSEDASLSRGRALAVRRYMIGRGVPADAITASGRGVPPSLGVETVDGVREPQDRRVEIETSIQSPQ